MFKDIIIGFSRAKSPWAIGSEIIAKSENRDYSHCFILCKDTDTGLYMVYQASRGYVNSMTFKNFSTDNIVVKTYTLPLLESLYKDVLTFMKDNLGVKYGYLQLILIAIKKLMHIEINIRNGLDREICSEFAARICKVTGIKVGDDLDYMTPSDLDKILAQNNVKCVKNT